MLRWVAAACLLLLAGCSQPPSAPPLDITHVHGVAYDGATGTLYLATHHGLARGSPDGEGWRWEAIGEPYDFMGFTQDRVRAGVFYSSGHPDDPYRYGGTLLGLRRSVDGGLTWEQRSLKGEVDFHALTALHGGEGWLAGSWRGAMKVSRDGGLTWSDHPSPPAAVFALASHETGLLAATSGGLYRTADLTSFANWTRLAGPSDSTVSTIATSDDGTALMASTGDGRSGSTYRSLDGGLTWSPLAHDLLADAASPVAFTFASGVAHAFAALADGKVLETRDGGETWTRLR